MAEFMGHIRVPVGRLHMELTNICNFSCEFCPDSRMTRPRGIMPMELAKSILDDVGRTKLCRLVLFHVMGEPTLYPHLTEVVAYASNRGIRTCLTTNGSRLDGKLLDEIIHAGAGQIIISLQTPEEDTFALRGARGVRFEDYAARIVSVVKSFLTGDEKTTLTLSFLSSPLRRLIIPVYREVSIADTSADLKGHLTAWAKRILEGSVSERRYDDVLKQISRTKSYRENLVRLSERVTFQTRILGDWAIHFDVRNVNAHFGYCPAIQDNFGILYNGDYVFCCTDYDGKTTTCNYRDASLREYLSSEMVQGLVREFNRLRVTHPHCKQCLGDRTILNATVRQIGSVAYFKLFRKNATSASAYEMSQGGAS